jgi:hypothetical protein
MDKSRFSIFEAVGNAYIFVGKEWPYLLKAGVLPVVAQIVGMLFVQFQRPEASLIESYLWELPAAWLFAWFMFIETRLFLLGERLRHLPRNQAYLADRQHSMNIAVLTSVLFNMGIAVILSAMLLVDDQSWKNPSSAGLHVAALVLLGAIIWAVRFGIIPTLAAVHYPIRPVLRQTDNLLFSLRLIGLGIACLLPAAFIFKLIIITVLPEIAVDPPAGVGDVHLTDAQQITAAVVFTIRSLVFTALLTAAVASALKQILGRQNNEAKA